jgi:hypothetical protein
MSFAFTAGLGDEMIPLFVISLDLDTWTLVFQE